MTRWSKSLALGFSCRQAALTCAGHDVGVGGELDLIDRNSEVLRVTKQADADQADSVANTSSTPANGGRGCSMAARGT